MKYKLYVILTILLFILAQCSPADHRSSVSKTSGYHSSTDFSATGNQNSLVQHKSQSQYSDTDETVREHYEILVKSGCDLKRYPVSMPSEARIMRNVPFAVAGKIFESPELTFLFNHDGGWYKPVKKNVRLHRADRVCVSKLKRKEKDLRKLLPIRKEVEQIITRSRIIFLEMRSISSSREKMTRSSSHVWIDRWSWSVVYAACGGSGTPEEIHDCSGTSFECYLPDNQTDLSSLVCEAIHSG